MAVGLPPIPCFTEYARDGTATFTFMLVDDLADKYKIILGNVPFAVGEKYVHEK